jgi:hypothetical protein
MIIFAINMRTIKQIIGVLTLTLFLGYYSGAVFFPHTHHYTSGNITHSHPYIPSSTHSHSSGSLHVIDHLSHAIVAIIPFLAFGIISPAKIFRYVVFVASLPVNYIHTNLTRGPPSVCL